MQTLDERRHDAKRYLRERGIVNLYRQADGTWAPPATSITGSRVLAQWIAARDRVPGRRFQARAFEAAKASRLTSLWTTSTESADSELRLGLAPLRARSRDLAANNAYAKRFLGMVDAHIVGPQGFALQMAVPSSVSSTGTDDLAATIIEREWAHWGKARNCDIAGRLSFRRMCGVAVRSAARDGEALVRKVRRKGLACGIALQLIEADRLDERLNGMVGQHRLVMGVEIDSEGRPVNYHLHTRHPGDTFSSDTRGDRVEIVPASDIVHLFTADRAEQRRGVPWFHAAAKRLRDLGNFEDSAVIAAHVGAAKMGFFTAPDADSTPLANAQDPTTGALIDEVEPGVFQTLPQGYQFQAFNPDYPSQNFDPFVKAALRGVAAGLGASYHVLSGDLTDVNFSSIRAGTLEEREGWMILQSWFAEAFLDPIFEAWLDCALLTGALDPLTPASRERYLRGVAWQGRRWQWVDPVKDVEAATRAIALGVKTRRQVCAEQGLDFDEVLAQLAVERAKMKELGLPDVNDPPAPAAPAPAQAAKGVEIRIDQPISVAPAAPTVNIAQPDVRVEPQFNIATPEVNVPPANVVVEGARHQIDVHVAAPERARATRKTVERDERGEIRTITETEIDTPENTECP